MSRCVSIDYDINGIETPSELVELFDNGGLKAEFRQTYSLFVPTLGRVAHKKLRDAFSFVLDPMSSPHEIIGDIHGILEAKLGKRGQMAPVPSDKAIRVMISGGGRIVDAEVWEWDATMQKMTQAF